MVANAFLTTHEDGAAIERIVRSLVRAREVSGGAIITTPVLFPSGAHVTVRISLSKDRCFITDDGAAFAEADMLGGSEIFKRIARNIAEESGIAFNSFELFEADAQIDRAAGMIAIVADAAKRAVQITTERLAKRAETDAREMVLDRLRTVFGKAAVTPNAHVSGSSTHEWHVDALVKTSNRLLVVESVTPSPISVSSAYMKLDDIRRIDDAPGTIAALRKKQSFASDQLLILSRAARLIDASGDELEFRRLAA